MDFNNVLLSCSRLDSVMSEPQGALTEKMFQKLEYLKAKEYRTEKQELERIELQFRMDNYDPKLLSKGCMMYLIFLYQYLKYGRQKYFMDLRDAVPQLVNGTIREKSSFEIIKRATGKQLFRSKGHIKNKYLRGQLDVIDAPSLDESSMVIDIKTSFRQFDFMKMVAADNLPRRYNFQMQGYLSLTGKEHGEIYYVLTDFTEEVIQDEKTKMFNILCPDGVPTRSFEEEWEVAENFMRFSHIPDEERVVFHQVERDDQVISKIYEKVEFCREWLSELSSKHISKIASYLEEWQKQLY